MEADTDGAARWPGPRRWLAQERGQARGVSMPLVGARTVSVAVSLNKAQVLQFPRPVRVVSVGNPEIADIVVRGSRQLYVLGRSTGTTNVVLWDQADNIEGLAQRHRDP
jgi:pilus assembly protein CpaC